MTVLALTSWRESVGFREPLQGVSASAQASLLGAPRGADPPAKLAILGDVVFTGLDRSSAEALAIPVATLADSLSRHLVREILEIGEQGAGRWSRSRPS